MKTNWRWIAIGILAAALSSARADKVTFEQLPQPVQKVIRAQAGNAPIEDIDREVRDGQTYYEVAFKRDGKDVELRLGGDGTILSGAAPVVNNPLSPASEPLSGARKVTLIQVPMVVREVIEAQAEGSPIEDIDVGILHGRTVYEAAFKRNGQHTELRVAEDGTVLNQTEPGISTELARLPVAVRQAIQAHIGTARIRDIDVERRNGKSTYEIEFERDGLVREVVFHQDGTIAENADALGAAGVPQVIGRGALESRRFTMEQLPSAVQTTARTHLGRSTVDHIDREVRDGKVIYEVSFTTRGGEHRELEIAENGTLLRTKTVTDPPAVIGRPQPLATAPLELRDLPRAARRTVQAQVGSATITDIDKDRINGRTVYEVEFSRDGRNMEILVDDDGALLDKDRLNE